jgi:hypothetical protein
LPGKSRVRLFQIVRPNDPRLAVHGKGFPRLRLRHGEGGSKGEHHGAADRDRPLSPLKSVATLDDDLLEKMISRHLSMNFSTMLDPRLDTTKGLRLF